jgi:oligopeptide transport system substrate-binding protein
MRNSIFANNLLLRKALSIAINREQLVDNVLKMGQKPLYSIVTPTINNGLYKNIIYDWANLTADQKLNMAKKLFKDAGYSETKPLKLRISYNTNDLHKKIALTIMSMWQDAFGKAIQIDIENSEFKNFLQKRHKGDYLIARNGWVADYDDVSTYTILYNCGSIQNDSHYCNPIFDNLIVQAINSNDNITKVDFYKKALHIALNDYQIIPLFQYNFKEMVKPRVIGYKVESNLLHHVQTKWMSLKND